MYDKKKYTKKKWLELQKQHRGTNGFNTGTRDMKSNKYPTRQEEKKFLKKAIDNMNY